jgi:hypothetical protein
MKEITFNNVISWVFYASIGFIALRGVNTLDKLENSVNDLNIKLAQVVTKSDGYDQQLYRQDERIRNLEIKNREK